jgi:exodeoxyribonuclease V beta subunit
MTRRYPRPQILREIPSRGHAIIEASAGTGKTYTLEHLIIDLLLRHPEVELENILVVTFTERATAELKHRVRRLLANVVASSRSEGPSASQQGLLTEEDEEAYWLLGDADRRKLERALFSFDIAPIYTIHAFCQRVLTEHAFANRRFFDQQHVDFFPLFERAFTDAMRRTLACQDSTRDWLEAWLETGTVEELQTMLSKTLLARAELWPKFHDEELERGLNRFGENFWGHYRALYTRSCRRRENVFLEAQNDWRQNRSVARFLMLGDSQVVDLKQSLKGIGPANDEELEFLKLVNALCRFKPAVAQKFLPIMQTALEEEKRRSGGYTFDDMLTMVWEGLERPVTGEWLSQALRRRYRFALIDEFQDTDEIQWKIFRRLFVETQNQQHRLFVIGDPKQAIYGFRNADVYTYLEACDELLEEDGHPPGENDESIEDELLAMSGESADEEAPLAAEIEVVEEEEEPTAVKLHLMQNWRSSAPLISAYNHLLDQQHERPFFSGNSIRYDHPVVCGNPALELRDARGEIVEPVVFGAMRPGDQSAGVRMNDIYECYGRWIAMEIKRLLSEPGKLYFGPEGELQPITARDIYVLTRTHSEELKLEKFLREEDIPYAFYKQDGLFRTPEAREFYELLRAIERPHERGRRLRAWATQFFSIELEELVKCRDVPEGNPLFKLLLEWSNLAHRRRFEELFTDILQRSGVIRREIFFGEDERALTNYIHIAEVLLEEAHLARLDIGELVMRCRSFLDGGRKPLSEDGDIKRVEDDRDAVQIMTMHKSKGLEAAVVFLYPFGGGGGEYWRFHYRDRQGNQVRAMHILKPEEKISPRLRERVEEESREEDERLLYVALTRAKARLYIPFVPYQGNQPICKWIAQRSYHVLNQKIREVWEEREFGKHAEWFALEEIPYFGIKLPSSRAIDINALGEWRPQDSLLAALEQPEWSFAKRVHPTLRVESYSSLKRRSGGYSTASGSIEDQELRGQDELGSSEDAVGLDELPGGVRTGLFLHDILERLDYSSLTRFQDVEEWAEDEDVHALFERSMLEHGVEPEYLALSQKVIWRALTGVVETDYGVVYGLGYCTPNVRELEFLYPIPEYGDPFLNELPEGSWMLERGFIKGYVDYGFVWNNRVFFADWKSDVLDHYDERSLELHFEQNYTKQALLYSVALCKVFGIHDEADYENRFGGAIYCFLRGMQDDSRNGVYRTRPTWKELLDFERRLREPDFGQGHRNDPDNMRAAE